jgi:hypothetical protein
MTEQREGLFHFIMERFSGSASCSEISDVIFRLQEGKCSFYEDCLKN